MVRLEVPFRLSALVMHALSRDPWKTMHAVDELAKALALFTCASGNPRGNGGTQEDYAIAIPDALVIGPVRRGNRQPT
jgi:hypothetical protein